jgi:protein-disulfide isomerase
MRRNKLDAGLWLGCGALALSIPFAIVPPYWQVAAYRVANVAFGHEEDGLPWIGAPEPEVVVHEYFDYECPHCPAAHIKLRRLLARHGTRLRIVRHDTPRVECPLAPVPGDDACRGVRGAYCASKQQKYWSWNDAALRLPRPRSGPTRLRYEEDLAAALALDSAAFSSCLDSPQAFAHARRRYREARSAKVLHLPSHMMNGKKVLVRDIEAELSKNH